MFFIYWILIGLLVSFFIFRKRIIKNTPTRKVWCYILFGFLTYLNIQISYDTVFIEPFGLIVYPVVSAPMGIGLIILSIIMLRNGNRYERIAARIGIVIALVCMITPFSVLLRFN